MLFPKLKAQSSKLERLFSLKRGKRGVRALSFGLLKMTLQVGLAAYMYICINVYDTYIYVCVYAFLCLYIYIYIHRPAIVKTSDTTANPTWGVIFESSKLEARTSLLPRFDEKRRSSFELWALKQHSKKSPQVGLAVLSESQSPQCICVCLCVCVCACLYIYIYIFIGQQ